MTGTETNKISVVIPASRPLNEVITIVSEPSRAGLRILICDDACPWLLPLNRDNKIASAYISRGANFLKSQPVKAKNNGASGAEKIQDRSDPITCLTKQTNGIFATGEIIKSGSF